MLLQSVSVKSSNCCNQWSLTKQEVFTLPLHRPHFSGGSPHFKSNLPVFQVFTLLFGIVVLTSMCVNIFMHYLLCFLVRLICCALGSIGCRQVYFSGQKHNNLHEQIVSRSSIEPLTLKPTKY